MLIQKFKFIIFFIIRNDLTIKLILFLLILLVQLKFIRV